MSHKCWTVISGFPVAFESLSKLAADIGVLKEDVSKAKSAAEAEGHTSAFKLKDRMIYLGDIPTDRKIIAKVIPPRSEGGLLRRGYVTHRLGVHNGGQW